MGTDKLLLCWQGRPLIQHHVDAWLASGVDRVVVVTRSTAGGLIARLKEYGSRIDYVVCSPEPIDMKQSIQQGLRFLQERFQPESTDAWLVAPADMPCLESDVIDAVCDAHRREAAGVVVPTSGGRRGHPVLFPWAATEAVFRLGPDEGLNAMVAAADRIELPVAAARTFVDVDTPRDYDLLQGRAREAHERSRDRTEVAE